MVSFWVSMFVFGSVYLLDTFLLLQLILDIPGSSFYVLIVCHKSPKNTYQKAEFVHVEKIQVYQSNNHFLQGIHCAISIGSMYSYIVNVGKYNILLNQHPGEYPTDLTVTSSMAWWR